MPATALHRLPFAIAMDDCSQLLSFAARLNVVVRAHTAYGADGDTRHIGNASRLAAELAAPLNRELYKLDTVSNSEIRHGVPGKVVTAVAKVLQQCALFQMATAGGILGSKGVVRVCGQQTVQTGLFLLK